MKKESFTIGYRSKDPGSIKNLVTVLLVLTIIISVVTIAAFIGGGLLFSKKPENAKVLFVIGGMFGFLTIVSIFVLIYEKKAFKMNNALEDNCIEYDGENHKLVLTTIKGEKIVIDPLAYVELQDNYYTENRLMFTYKTEDGKLKKVNLGFCSNREQLRELINTVIMN